MKGCTRSDTSPSSTGMWREISSWSRPPTCPIAVDESAAIAQYVVDLEQVFTNERGQWGQLTVETAPEQEQDLAERRPTKPPTSLRPPGSFESGGGSGATHRARARRVEREVAPRSN
jgi:hypothetical protein